MKIKASVWEYYSKDNVDFWVVIKTAAGKKMFYIQPEVRDNKIVGVTTPDSQDDLCLLNESLYGDIEQAMQEALDEWVEQ